MDFSFSNKYKKLFAFQYKKLFLFGKFFFFFSMSMGGFLLRIGLGECAGWDTGVMRLGEIFLKVENVFFFKN